MLSMFDRSNPSFEGEADTTIFKKKSLKDSPDSNLEVKEVRDEKTPKIKRDELSPMVDQFSYPEAKAAGAAAAKNTGASRRRLMEASEADGALEEENGNVESEGLEGTSHPSSTPTKLTDHDDDDEDDMTKLNMGTVGM